LSQPSRAFFARVILAGALVSCQAACGGSSPGSPTPSPQPSPQPVPPPPPPPTQSDLWTVSGRVVALGDGRAVGGARLTTDPGPSTDSDAGGAFRLAGNSAPQGTLLGFTIDSPAYVPHKAYLRYQPGTRENVTFDLIPLAAPFSIDFYRALVRNAHETPGQLEPLRRWTTNPRFYVRSADQNGRPIEPEVMTVVLASIPEAVRQFSGGVLSVSQLESGPETRAPAAGWITVNIIRDPSLPYCGQSFIARDPGEIVLVNDRCNCGSVKISGGLVAHEVGHALGFWHVSDPRHVMYDTHPSGCPAVDLSTEERFHAALAYKRPPGNRDPDIDPATTAAAQLDAAGADAPVATCGLR
jgi:hypothetical protein